MNIRYGLSAQSVRKQLIEFFGIARVIIAANPERQLTNLGFNRDQVNLMVPKLIDLEIFYSPPRDRGSFYFRCIAHLVSHGAIEFPTPHPPTFSAFVGMKLYLLCEPRIHQEPFLVWPPNKWVSRLFSTMNRQMIHGQRISSDPAMMVRIMSFQSGTI